MQLSPEVCMQLLIILVFRKRQQAGKLLPLLSYFTGTERPRRCFLTEYRVLSDLSAAVLSPVSCSVPLRPACSLDSQPIEITSRCWSISPRGTEDAQHLHPHLRHGPGSVLNIRVLSCHQVYSFHCFLSQFLGPSFHKYLEGKNYRNNPPPTSRARRRSGYVEEIQ